MGMWKTTRQNSFKLQVQEKMLMKTANLESNTALWNCVYC